MLTPSCNGGNWLIQIPLSELVALQELPTKIEELERQNVQLRREIDGLRCMYSQALQMLGDIRHDMYKR